MKWNHLLADHVLPVLVVWSLLTKGSLITLTFFSHVPLFHRLELAWSFMPNLFLALVIPIDKVSLVKFSNCRLRLGLKRTRQHCWSFVENLQLIDQIVAFECCTSSPWPINCPTRMREELKWVLYNATFVPTAWVKTFPLWFWTRHLLHFVIIAFVWYAKLDRSERNLVLKKASYNFVVLC